MSDLTIALPSADSTPLMFAALELTPARVAKAALGTAAVRARTTLLIELDDILNEITDVIDETAFSECGPLPWVVHAQPIRVFDEDANVSRRRRAIEALDRVQHALALTDIDAAAVIGVSRGSLRNWRLGRSPHPGTTRKLFEVDNLLRALATVLGDRLPAWLDTPSPGGPTRREQLALADGPVAVAAAAQDVLFHVPGAKVLGELDYGDEPEPKAASAWAPELFRGRRKQPSRHR
jgi:hypothetical protein